MPALLDPVVFPAAACLSAQAFLKREEGPSAAPARSEPPNVPGELRALRRLRAAATKSLREMCQLRLHPLTFLAIVKG